MKKPIYALGMAMAVVACKQEAPVDYVLLSGKIANNTKEIQVSSMDRSFSKEISVGEDGSFSDTLRVAEGTYRLINERNMVALYLNAGNNIVINADASDFQNTVTVTGEGAEITNYLLAKAKTASELRGEGNTMYELEEADYKAKSEEIKSTLTGMLDTTVGISDDYKAKEKRNLNYEHLSRLSMYERYHAWVTKKQDFKVSEGFLSELDGITYDNEEDYAFSSSYKQMVSSHYREKAAELAEADSMPRDLATLKTYTGISSETIKNELLYGSASNGITYTSDAEAYYNIFMAASTNEEHKSKITETYNQLKKVAKGQPSPKFVDFENNAGGTTSLDDLKGKYVYVDVWATWCGPCKAEIPFLKKVEEQYHGKNIEFVSISVDKPEDYDKWKAMIVEKELGGIQLITGTGWETSFTQEYLIKGIPRFILIDPNGNIVTANAPRPSNEDLITLFDELKI